MDGWMDGWIDGLIYLFSYVFITLFVFFLFLSPERKPGYYYNLLEIFYTILFKALAKRSRE